MSAEGSERLGVGFIGFGDHCENSHGPFVGRSALYDVVGVAEKDDIRSAKAQQMLGLPDSALTMDYRELLDNDATQAVIITTGDQSHYNLAREALYAGKSVLLEKPAAATAEECAELPSLFDYAQRNGLKFWVCHPREFDKEGPWFRGAELIGNPDLVEATFGVGPVGKLLEVRYDCFYTLPDTNKAGLHTSFADDKMNHNVASVLTALPGIAGFSGAILLKNTLTNYDVSMDTIPQDENDEPIAIRMSGRRCARRANHPHGIYRDWVEATFEDAILRIEPSYGTIALTYGKEPRPPIAFDPDKLYDDMFTAINDEFALCVLDPKRPEPLTRRAKLLGTAAAILVQQPGFDGMITEESVSRLTRREGSEHSSGATTPAPTAGISDTEGGPSSIGQMCSQIMDSVATALQGLKLAQEAHQHLLEAQQTLADGMSDGDGENLANTIGDLGVATTHLENSVAAVSIMQTLCTEYVTGTGYQIPKPA